MVLGFTVTFNPTYTLHTRKEGLDMPIQAERGRGTAYGAPIRSGLKAICLLLKFGGNS